MAAPKELERHEVGGVLMRRFRHQDGHETLRVAGKILTPEQASRLANLITGMVLRTNIKPKGTIR